MYCIVGLTQSPCSKPDRPLLTLGLHWPRSVRHRMYMYKQRVTRNTLTNNSFPCSARISHRPNGLWLLGSYNYRNYVIVEARLKSEFFLRAGRRMQCCLRPGCWQTIPYVRSAVTATAELLVLRFLYRRSTMTDEICCHYPQQVVPDTRSTTSKPALPL